MSDSELAVVPVETISSSILQLRGQRVILDTDLARLYGVQTKTFNQAVKRNLARFPPDFMFQLTQDELQDLRSQFVTPSQWGGRRYLPYAFTEHGAAMAASILRSPQAVEVSVYVVRAFVRMREMLSSHAELSHKLEELDSRLTARIDTHDKYLAAIVGEIRELRPLPEDPQRRIGFRPERSPK